MRVRQRTAGICASAAVNLSRHGDQRRSSSVPSVTCVVVGQDCPGVWHESGESIHVDGGLHLPGYNSRPANVPVREY